jgi:CRISPR-associated endonuclease Csn1
VAELTLGIDVGTNSMGWSLVDRLAGKIHATGVRVFPEGVDRDQQGGEKSKTQSRRDARGTRRQIHRRARRRQLLRRALTASGLLPSDPNALNTLLSANPYELRRRALSEKLELHEIGRVLMHLTQRRGYLSNRKTDKSQEKDNKGMLKEIGDLAATIDQSGTTLGGYLAELDRCYNRCNAGPGPHIRRRPTHRAMYEHEFNAIWEAQQKHYPGILTDAFKYGNRGKQIYPKKPDRLGSQSSMIAEYGIYGLIFFQRKMYWPKSVVGRCELEPREKRCPRSARIAQRFRILQEVNNLRILDRTLGIERRLDDAERSKLVEYLSGTKEATFDQMRKKLKLHEDIQFNLERGGRSKLQGHLPDAALSGKKSLGKRWEELAEPTKNAIVDVLI